MNFFALFFFFFFDLNASLFRYISDRFSSYPKMIKINSELEKNQSLCNDIANKEHLKEITNT